NSRPRPCLWPSLNPEIAAFAALRDAQEKVLQRRPLLDQALLVRVADQRLEVLYVLFRKPVFPRVGTKKLLLLLPGVEIPGERHDARILHALHRDGLRFIERLEKIDREPRMLFGDRLADA